jgi:hypothetical protein
MANILTGLIPTIYDDLDTVAREQIGFLPAVNKNASADGAAIGQSITYYQTAPGVMEDTTASFIPTASADQTIAPKSMTLQYGKTYKFDWTGEEQLSVKSQLSGISGGQFAQGFRALDNYMEQTVAAAALVGASRAIGTAGSAPFTGTDMMPFSSLGRALDDNGAPAGGRSLILSPSGRESFRGKQSNVYKANEGGGVLNLRTGAIDNLYDFDIGTSRWAGVNVGGTGASYTVSGASVAGQTVLTLAAGTGTILPGNVVTIGNFKYVVVTGTAAPGTITIQNPGLMEAVVSGATVTLSATYTANTAFQANAIQLMVRTPALPTVGDMAIDRTYVTSPISGITYEVAVYAGVRKVQFQIGVVWGVQVVKPEFVATLLGN